MVVPVIEHSVTQDSPRIPALPPVLTCRSTRLETQPYLSWTRSVYRAVFFFMIGGNGEGLFFGQTLWGPGVDGHGLEG